MEKKESIILYIPHYEVLKNLSDSDFGKLYKAIFEFRKGNEVKLSENLKIPFGFIKNQMVLDNKKYEEKCEINKENGKKGGRPKKTKKANGFFENPNDNENDNENVNENENDNENDYNYNIFDYIERSFVITVNGTNLEKIQNYLQTYDDEILCYAIDVCVANGVTNLSYFFGIVDNWISSKYKTLDEIKLKDKKKNRSNNEIPLVPTSEHSWKIGG